MVQVLVVDDSPTCRLALRHVLESDRGVRVVGEASDGARAERLVQTLRPQLITMDVHLGAENGIEVAGRIMGARATPILIVTGVDPHDPDLAFRALQAGALEVCPKPPAPGAPAYAAYRTRLLRAVHALSSVPVVTRRRRRSAPARSSPAPPRVEPRPTPGLGGACALVAIGASTGGPPLLHALLRALPPPYPLPIAIVQHIATGFVAGLAAWLGAETGHEVAVCSPREPLRPGRVYLARDECHLRLLGPGEIGSVGAPPRGHQRPSVDELFETAAVQLGAKVGAVLLTGMGSDGADGLARLRACGATTIVQEPKTCVVSGMPSAAIDAGAATWVLSPPEIAGALHAFASRRPSPGTAEPRAGEEPPRPQARALAEPVPR